MSELASKAVFLSYASQDVAAALRISTALRAAGVEVWFDQDALVGGDAWDAKIRGQIGSCALFMPVISAHTQARPEGYFRLEWKLAAQRTHMISERTAFLLPVLIDATRDAEADVPTEFRAVQWTKLPGGETSALFVARVQKLLGGPIAVVATSAPGSAQPSAPAQAAGSGLPRWVGVALGVIVLALIGYFVTRPDAKDATTAPKSVAETKTLPVAVPAPVPLPADKSIAVLAFENRSTDRDNESFSDGISDEILNLLGKVPGLRVAGRNSAFSFKGKKDTESEIAQKLGVAYVVTGTVQKSGTQVRIAARLTNAADGFVLWSDTLTEDLKDIFAVQDKIAGHIAQNLSLTLRAGSRVTKTVVPEAHGLVLEGRHRWFLRTPEGLEKAEQAFKAAIAIDPNFAQAHAGLADVYVIRATYALQDGQAGLGENVADIQLARVEAQRAIELEPGLAEPYSAIGYVALMEGRFAEADQQFQKALALNPNDTISHAWLSMLRLTQGRLDLGMSEIKKSTELDPLWAVNFASFSETLLIASRLTEALQVTGRVMEMRPDILITNLGYRSRILLALGRTAEAVEVARLIRKNLSRSPRRDADSSAIWVLRQAGQPEEAQAYAEEYSHTLPERSPQRGFVLGALGRFAEALPYLERTPHMPRRRLFWDPMWDQWRDDPRFQQLMVKLGCAAEYKVARETLARMLKEQAKT